MVIFAGPQLLNPCRTVIRPSSSTRAGSGGGEGVGVGVIVGVGGTSVASGSASVGRGSGVGVAGSPVGVGRTVCTMPGISGSSLASMATEPLASATGKELGIGVVTNSITPLVSG